MRIYSENISAAGATNNLQIRNPIKIETDFDISKDAKFSIRTLMLLSILAIALFSFKITPTLLTVAGIPQIKINDPFAWFMIIIIFGQGVIAWLNYDINKNKIDLEILKLEKKEKDISDEIIKLGAEILEWESNITIENHNQNIKTNALYNIKLNKKKIDNLKLENVTTEEVLRDYNLLYRHINETFVFWLASIAIASAIVFCTPITNIWYKIIFGLIITIFFASFSWICKLIYKIYKKVLNIFKKDKKNAE